MVQFAGTRLSIFCARAANGRYMMPRTSYVPRRRLLGLKSWLQKTWLRSLQATCFDPYRCKHVSSSGWLCLD